MKFILTILFILALATPTYFFGKLITWHAYRINPKTFKKEFTDKDILNANIIMVISIILWGITFYNLIK
jgi:hypothetical protein